MCEQKLLNTLQLQSQCIINLFIWDNFFSKNWDSLGPLILFHRSLDETMPQDIEWAAKIKKFYFGDEGKISKENLENFKHLVAIQIKFLLYKVAIYQIWFLKLPNPEGQKGTLEAWSDLGILKIQENLCKYIFDGLRA